MKKFLPIFILLFATVCSAQQTPTYAQLPSVTPTTGDCAKWASGTQLGDAGVVCASSAAGGTNTAVQYNSNGALGGNVSQFAFDPSKYTIFINGTAMLDFVQGSASGTSCNANFGSALNTVDWQICANGQELQFEHPGSGGNGRLHVDSDFLIGPSGKATALQNFNSFALDSEGSYYTGTAAAYNLWEMAVSTTPASGGTINSRENLYPIFTGACSGCTADFAIGGTGTNPAQGNPVTPTWDFQVQTASTGVYTATFSRPALTANQTYVLSPIGGTVPAEAIISQTGIAPALTSGSSTSYTILTPTANGLFRPAALLVATTSSAGCTTDPSMRVDIGWTDADTNTARVSQGSAFDPSTASGVFTPTSVGLINAKSGVAVTAIVTTVTAPVGCTTSAVLALHAEAMP